MNHLASPGTEGNNNNAYYNVAAYQLNQPIEVDQEQNLLSSTYSAQNNHFQQQQQQPMNRIQNRHLESYNIQSVFYQDRQLYEQQYPQQQAFDYQQPNSYMQHSLEDVSNFYQTAAATTDEQSVVQDNYNCSQINQYAAMPQQPVTHYHHPALGSMGEQNQTYYQPFIQQINYSNTQLFQDPITTTNARYPVERSQLYCNDQDEMDLHPTIKQQQEQREAQNYQQRHSYSNSLDDNQQLMVNYPTHMTAREVCQANNLEELNSDSIVPTQVSTGRSKSSFELSEIKHAYVTNHNCNSSLNDSSVSGSVISSTNEFSSPSTFYQSRSLSNTASQCQPDEQLKVTLNSTPSIRQDIVDMKSSGSVPQDWLDTICSHFIDHMNRFGICVIDNFLGSLKSDLILKEVQQLFSSRQYIKGTVVNNKVTNQTFGTDVSAIRNDRVIWVEGHEEGCSEINNLIQTLCSVITNSSRLSLYSNNGLDKIVINKRTKAHVACYPGNGTRYIKHVDNPNNDGRFITSIYYCNKDWNTKRDGGLLRMFPTGMDEVANIEPLFDRVLFFWSDRRNPHEVLPAYKNRFAITVWYIGESRP